MPYDPEPRLRWTWIHGSTRWSLGSEQTQFKRPRFTANLLSVSPYLVCLLSPSVSLLPLMPRHTVKRQHKIQEATKLGRLSLCFHGDYSWLSS